MFLCDNEFLCKILNDFNTLTLTQIFWKMKTVFKKLEYRFLVESTKIENALFPYKTAVSEANVKTNRMSEYKMDLSQRTEFCQEPIYFFENIVSV